MTYGKGGSEIEIEKMQWNWNGIELNELDCGCMT